MRSVTENRSPTSGEKGRPGKPGLEARAVLLLAAFVPIYLFASPFRFGEKSGGRYLLGVLQHLDPELFPGDAAIVALDRFGSLFYSSAGFILHRLGVSAEALEPTWYGLYLLARLALLLALFYLGRAVDDRLGVALALLAWGAHGKASFVGGTALFVPALTHHQLAVLLCLLALGLLSSRATRGAETEPRTALTVGGLIGLALLVHPLVAIYFVAALAPALFSSRSQKLASWLPAAALLTLAAVLYLLFLAPPSMSPQEAALFLAHKADSGHVSPWHQPPYAWLKLALLLALAVAGSSRLLEGAVPRMLRAAALCGGALALALALLVDLGDSAFLTRLQPLRGFLWVQFFAEVLLLWGCVSAWRRRSTLLPALLGVLAFLALDSIWSLAWMLLALVLLVAERFVSLEAERLRTLGRLGVSLLLLSIAVFYLLGERQPLASARDGAGMIAAACLGWLVLDGSWRRRTAQLALLIVAVLAAASWREHRAVQHDLAWEETGRWVRQHTAKEARFLTRPGLPNFRFAAWRTSDSEALSALYWVDPSALQPAHDVARRFEAARRDAGWDLEALLDLGRRSGSDYLLLDGAVAAAPESALPPVFERGPYRIFALPRSEDDR